MTTLACPRCARAAKQVKAGLKNGRQQYLCTGCRHRYVPDGLGHRYSESVKEQAISMRREGATLRSIAERFGVTSRTLSNWLRKPALAASDFEDESGRPLDPPLADQLPQNGAPDGPVKRRVTIHDVAERAGVAVSTVSNYLNGKGRMGDATRGRVKDAISELHFTPSGLTRAIRQRLTRIVGVQTFGLWDLDEGVGYSIIPPILTGINRTADISGREILLYTSGFKADQFGGTRFLDGHIDGLLWVGPALYEPVLEYTAQAGLPMIALLTHHVPASTGYVNADNASGMRAVVDHLLSLGRRRIGYYGPLYASNYIDRYDVFRQAMAEAGLEWDEAPMQFAIRPKEPWQPSKFDQGVNCLISMADKLDAIILSTDQMAARAIEMLRNRGICVPDDVAVVGFDDVPSAATAGGIGLTTVRQPFRQIGQMAVERLLALIDGAPVEECRVTLPTELVIRGSTVRG